MVKRGPKPLGIALAVISALMLAVAMHSLLRVAACTGPEICDTSGWAVLGLPVGIVLGIAAAFTGGFLAGFSGPFLGIGVGALVAGLQGGEIQVFGILFGGAFIIGGLAPFALMPIGRGMIERRSAEAAAIMRDGVGGIATITQVLDTGVTINENPRVEVHVRIDPKDGSPSVERKKTVTVSRVAIPDVGDRFPAWFMPHDHGRWMMGMDLTDEALAKPEVRRLIDEATEPAAAPPPATGPLGDLKQLNDLRLAGALTDEEFQTAKDKLLRAL